MKKVIAVDLGASNGRLMIVTLEGQRLTLEELHRFSNEPVERNGHFFWDISSIFTEVKNGLNKYVVKYGPHIDGIGFDTWGVDFGMISEKGDLLGDPYSYRDTHTNEIMPKVHQQISDQELFTRTGIESAPINTLYQLVAVFNKHPEFKKQVSTILTMPSLLGFLFTNQTYNEFTHASTTQLLNTGTQDWDGKIIEKVFAGQLPLAEIKATNTVVGYTKNELNEEIGIEPIPVINVPGHDTACALAAMPLHDRQTAFMSCGTWVLIGIEVDQPIVTKEAFEWGFTNEGTMDKTYRLQKNNMGLWLLQQCKKDWEKDGEFISYQEESNLLMEAEPFKSLIDPDHELFFNPRSMTEAIQTYCQQTEQKVPTTKGEFIRCILESLALKYRWVIERLAHLTEKEIPSIHMAGGGIQNKWLCQFTANATKKPVKAGPVEASSIGNALSQLIALGVFDNLEEARRISSYTFNTIDYTPMDLSPWDQAYSRFIKLI
ncbi:MAG TPA: rhamnulokinase family protein [Bacillota bacterium]|nr:rhamnulokinase family protein [Bacillota bacterium]